MTLNSLTPLTPHICSHTHTQDYARFPACLVLGCCKPAHEYLSNLPISCLNRMDRKSYDLSNIEDRLTALFRGVCVYVFVVCVCVCAVCLCASGSWKGGTKAFLKLLLFLLLHKHIHKHTHKMHKHKRNHTHTHAPHSLTRLQSC